MTYWDTMHALHIDLLYIQTRTNFHTNVVIKNNMGDILGVCRPLYLSRDKTHNGFYSFPCTVQGKQHAMTMPFSTNSEKSLSIFQILPDTQQLHFLCTIDISYNFICFKRGVFCSERFTSNSYGAAVHAHKSDMQHGTRVPRREFVHISSTVLSLQTHVRSSDVRVFENSSSFFDEWHLQFYSSMYDLVRTSFSHHTNIDDKVEDLCTCKALQANNVVE